MGMWDVGFSIARGGGHPSRLIERASLAAVDTLCADCGKRVGTDREVRQVGVQFFVFHKRCVRTGMLQKHIEITLARTPAAIAQRRDAEREIAAAQRWRG